MILRSVELEAFGRFSRRSFEFRRGLNLVVGPNEAGKSTLMESIPAILFGVRDKQRFIPWGRSGPCRGSLQFETGAGSVRVQRDIQSDEVGLEWTDQLYQTRRQVSGKASPQGRSGEKKAYLLELQDLLGFRDADLFRATLFFGQGDLDLDFGKNLSERIKNLLSGSAEIDYDQVLDDLEETLFEVTRENPWGKDKTRDRQLELTEKELARLSDLLQRGEVASVEYAQLEEQLHGLEAGLQDSRQELAKGEKYLQWIRTYWQAQEQRKQLEQGLSAIQDQQSKRQRLEQQKSELQQCLSGAGLSLAEVASTGIHDQLLECRRYLLQLQALQKERLQLRQNMSAKPDGYNAAIWIWSLVIASASGCGAWLYPQLQIHIALAAIILTAPVWIWSVWRRGNQTVRQSEQRGKAQLLEQQQLEVQQRLDKLGAQLTAVGMPVRLEELDRLLDVWSCHRDSLQKFRDIDSALGILPCAEELEKSCAAILRDLALLEQRQQQGRALRSGVDLEATELEAAERKLEQLRQSIQHREDERNRLWLRRAECGAQLGGRAQLEEDRAEILDEVVTLQRRKRILCLACDVLRESVSEFRSDYLKRFSGRVGPFLETVSAGVYPEVRLHDDLAIDLRSRQGQWKPLAHFSQGTRDAVALAVRLAFVNQFSQGRNLPLLLDDALVNLDSDRQSRMLAMLKRLSQDHQVILFSHDQGLAKRAARERWHVLPLEDRPQPSGAGKGEEEHAGQLHLL